MKKLLLSLIILISINSFSQNLDTVYVRNLSLRAEEWYWLKNHWYPQTNLEKTTWKKMRTKLVADAPPNNSTMVTIDSIPGKIAIRFYTIFLEASKGETSFMTNNISSNIKAYTPMIIHTNKVDDDLQGRFQNARRDGKDDFDN